MLSINFVMKAERNYLLLKKFVLMPDQIYKVLVCDSGSSKAVDNRQSYGIEIKQKVNFLE